MEEFEPLEDYPAIAHGPDVDVFPEPDSRWDAYDDPPYGRRARELPPLDTVWVGREDARTPKRFRDRVLTVFRGPRNLEYLYGFFARKVPRGRLRDFTLSTLHDAVYTYSMDQGPALEVLQFDPIAQRGGLRPAMDLWAELRRLNLAFIQYRMRTLHDHAALIDPVTPHDAVADDDEPYHMRMFVADSLRPPGLEHLNGPGPLYELREDQTESTAWRVLPPQPDHRRPPRPPKASKMPGVRELFGSKNDEAARPAKGTGASGSFVDIPRLGTKKAAVPLVAPWSGPRATRDSQHSQLRPLRLDREGRFRGVPDPDPQYDEEEGPWDAGDPNRTPEQAVAEYWGDDKVPTETSIGAPETVGVAYGNLYAWGDSWQDNGGTRLMRWTSPPFWQKGGREGYDYDIEENLGTAGRELDNHVRRWPLDRIRDHRGEEYRRYGPRTGPFV